jgi:hypothetical protein
MRVVEFPGSSVATVVDGLRALADAIETEGEHVHNVAYAIDKGDGNVQIGLLGQAPHPATTCHFLLTVGQAKLVRGALDE